MGINPSPDSGQPLILLAGATLTKNLDFQAHAVKVDNPTGQWLQLQDAVDGFVAPGQLGAIINLGGLQQINAQWAPPPGVRQPNPVTGQQAQLRAYSFWLAPNPGAVAQSASFGTQDQQLLTPAYTVPANGLTVSRTVSLPPGAVALGIGMSNESPTGSITVTGVQSGIVYPVISFAALGGRLELVLALFPGTGDTQLQISILNANSATTGAVTITSVYLLALFQIPPQLASPSLGPRDAAVSSAHPNAAAPLANVIVWSTGNLWLHSWDLTFDGVAAGAFASVTFAGVEWWNMSLASRLWSSRSFGPVLIGDSSKSPLAFAAPTGAYNARGEIAYSVA
jgi:hypothetical protein